MKKIVYLFFALFILGGAPAVCSEFGGIKVYNVRLPIYNKDRLRYMIFCAAMTRKADKIFAEDSIIDIVKNNIDVNKIVYFENLKLYKLGTSPEAVAEFWKDKTNTTGFISSSRAVILQDSQIASGDKKVLFRSPKVDLNGVGFTANFDTRITKVHHKVNILLRMKTPKKGEQISKKDIVKIQADSMIMDMQKDLITLIGNVKVDDSGFDIFCDRLVLDLNKDNKVDKKESAKETSQSGFSKISCFGKVKIFSKTADGEVKKGAGQRAFADKAVYLKSKEQFILTGKNSRIYDGNDMLSGDKIIIWKETGRLQAFKNCFAETGNKSANKPKKTILKSDFIDFDHKNNLGIFTGHVRVKDTAFKLNCNKMLVYLQERKKKKKTDSSKKEINKIVCIGSVIADDPAARVNCDRMVITLRDIAPGSKNTDGAVSDTREIDLIKCFDNVHMINKPKDPKTKSTIVNSDKAVLNIRGNVTDLLGNVKIEEESFYLTCNKMKILSKDITPEQAAANAAVNLENPEDTPKHIGIGDTKEITKVICLEKVVMTRKLSFEKQEARGDKGVYIINDHMITLTNNKGKPTLRRGPTLMEGNKIILWTNSEKLDIEEGTLKSIDGSGILN